MANEIKPKFDFSDIDTSSIDPDKVVFGTCAQDCSQITNVFERGAHSTASEAAVFATLTRMLQNNKRIANTTSSTLGTYLSNPQIANQESTKQAESLGLNVGFQGGGEVSQSPAVGLSSFTIGDQNQNSLNSNFGEKILDYARDCIPCDLRLFAFLELHPNIDLLETLEQHYKSQLKMLGDISNLLNNFDTYADFCDLLNQLSFLCIPDLQRIIATLSALLLLEVPQLDARIGVLQALIVPMFSPILMAITSLLDQFTTLVTSPLDCVLLALSEQLRNFQASAVSNQTGQGISAGLQQLHSFVSEGKLKIEDKLKLYIDQIKAMLGELGSGDSAYLDGTLRKLQTVRMIQFVIALVNAKVQGHSACSSTKDVGISEIDSFFETFLNPTNPFNLHINEQGEITVIEDIASLPNVENVVQFEGTPLLEGTETLTQDVTFGLTQTVRVLSPCKLERTASNIEQVNTWISELNKVG